MSFKLTLRGNVWHYAGTIAGRRIRGTTGTSDKALAQRVAAQAYGTEWERHLHGVQAVLTMAEAMHSYLDAGKSTRFLAKIADHWKETKVKAITPEAIKQSARKLYPEGSTATWNRQVIVPTAAVINHAAGMGWCSAIKVKRFPVDAQTKEAASPAWVRAFADQATKDGLPHLAALCLFMFGTGARIGQSCDMRWGDVDLAKATATLFTEKPTPWTRTAHLQPQLVVALANLPSNRDPAERVFGYAGRGSVKTAWESVIDRAGIDDLTPHSCRHGFATTMLQAGFDVKTVAEMGGWRDPVVVLRTYAHALKDKTVTNVLFDTNPAQVKTSLPATIGNKRRKNA